ncbi:unnamed protein product [Polarella glacialis]|uniref:Uncharacterized protein n=1 Tax=Polarella glacialis TaxID=89957 RepID=A0A813IU08_POLGL|nr:unnamed protein product [Polarella glacialis]CAE8656869.1 unnamed protein product [Polarella glacialis]
MGQALDVSGMATSALSMGLEHKRSNHLHRESVAQSLRIHEAEARAAIEYHRVAMNMANEQHARETVQARLIHEENVDLEKRIAVRENLRDEWTQLTERAGTVLIVNTLVLGVAFGMLVDGPLPACITLTHPMLTVAYFCALSSSINLLLCSVRFAMLLRFRVGRIIVQEMRDAILASARSDEDFRQSPVYLQLNRPCFTKGACDDNERKRFVEPLTAHMASGSSGPQAHAGEGGIAFMNAPGRGYQDLQWLKSGSGFALRQSVQQAMGCRKRSGKNHREQQLLQPQQQQQAEATTPQPAVLGRFSAMPFEGSVGFARSSSGDDVAGVRQRPMQPACPPAPLLLSSPFMDEPHQKLGSRVSRSRSYDGRFTNRHFTSKDGNERDHNFLSHNFSSHQSGGPPAMASAASPELPPAPPRLPPAPAGLGPSKEEYQSAILFRREQDAVLQQRLVRLRDQLCRPWDHAAQMLFFGGAVALMLASCLLVTGRWAFKKVALPEGAVAFPAARLAAWGFSAPCVVTVILMVFLQVVTPTQTGENNLSANENRKESSRASGLASGLPSGGRKPKLHSRARKSREVSAACDGVSRVFASCLARASASVDHRRSVRFVSLGLMCCSAINLLAFILAAQFVDPDELPIQDAAHAQAEAGGGTALVLGPSLPLVPKAVPLALGGTSEWPSFWEPSAATWWPERGTLLVTGGQDLLELRITDGVAVIAWRQKISSAAPLEGVCASLGFAPGLVWLVASDGTLFQVSAAQETPTSALAIATTSWSDSSYDDLLPVRIPRAMGCSASEAALSEDGLSEVPNRSSLVNFWLAGNREPWPVLDSADFMATARSTSEHPAPELQIAYRWQSEWLRADPALAAFLGATASQVGTPASQVGMFVEDVEVLMTRNFDVGETAASQSRLMLFLLVTRLSSSGDNESSVHQLVVGLDRLGRVRGWQRLAPAFSVSSRAIAQGVVRWVSLAADVAGGYLLLMSGGQQPRLSTVRMPDWASSK